MRITAVVTGFMSGLVALSATASQTVTSRPGPEPLSQVTGIIESVDRATGAIGLLERRAAGNNAPVFSPTRKRTFSLDPDTEIVAGSRRLRPGALREGEQVLVTYRREQGRPVAQEIEIQRDPDPVSFRDLAMAR